jgi:hypothetical protein
MNVTDITRILSRKATVAFEGIEPDHVRTSPVRKLKNLHLISSDPLTAGNDLHRLLQRMGDDEPLSASESAYFPWISTLRRMIWDLGAWRMDIDAPLAACGSVPHGTCDLLVHGGPRRCGVVEVKVISKGSQESPRARDLVQLAAYARLCARSGSFDDLWGGVAYMELEARQVRLLTFDSARRIIAPTLALIRAA